MDNENSIVQKAWVETALSIAAGLSFYILCMILPLVGPAGSRVAHAAKNRATFLAVLAVTLILSVSTVYVRLQRRRTAGGSLPVFGMVLSGLSLLLLLGVLSNMLAI